jgi:hypothetical protein
MDTHYEVMVRINAELARREHKVLNANAAKALFAALGDRASALGQIFLGRSDALTAERQRLAQEEILRVACRVVDLVEGIDEQLDGAGFPRTKVSGRIEAHGDGVDAVVGALVEEPVEFLPGTHITATARNARAVTGLHVGGRGAGR